MKKLLLIFTTLFISTISFSQYNIAGSGNMTERARDIQRKSKLNNFSQNKIQNTKFNIFLNEDWKGGVMFSDDSTSVNGFTYRYNIYTDQIELRSTVNPSEVKMITIGTKKFVYSTFYDEDSIKNEGYFELIANGSCKLLLRRHIEFQHATGNIEAYGSNASTAIEERLFIKKDNEPAVELEKTKDFLKSYLSDKEEAVEYMDNKLILFLTLKRIKDIVEYYNRI